MDPLTLIVTAVVAGAAAAAKDTVTQAVKDGYAGLKALLARKFSQASNADEVNAALKLAEKKPDDKGRQETLKDELRTSSAANDSEVLDAAQKLLELVRQQAPAVAAQYNITVQGSGAAAVGQGASAVGAGGVIVQGNNSGGINTGTQTVHNYYGSTSDPADAASGGLVASEEGRKLYQLLNSYFNLSEIEGLCFELGIDDENLRGETKAGKARALVQQVDATKRLDELKKLMRVQRPNLREQLR